MRDPFRNFNTYKIDPISEIRNAGIVTAGDVYWVSAESDSAHTSRTDSLGKKEVKTSIQAAIDECASDQNDYVLVVPKDDNGTWGLGTALDINEDRLHLLSVGYTKARVSYTNTILGSYGTVPDSEVVAVTGNGVELGGFHLLGTMGTNAGGTMTNAVLYVDADDVWGHDLYVEMNQGAWSTPPALKFAGTEHGNRFDDSEFAVTGTGNAEAAVAGVIALGNGGQKMAFHNCVISATCGSTSDALVASGTGNKEYTLFKNCDFVNNDVSFSVASAIIGSTTVDNPVICMNCSVVGCAQIGTDPSVYVAPVGSGTKNAVYNPNVAMGTAAVVAS